MHLHHRLIELFDEESINFTGEDGLLSTQMCSLPSEI